MKYITSALFLNIFMLYAPGSGLQADTAVVPGDKEYYKYTQDGVELIYTEDNLPFARDTAAIERSLNKDYSKFYDWKLDETLYVGLVSDCNQIANGFSTQWPNNRQINYIGGVQRVDYFSSTSWLETLLYHESAHNYQANVKGDKLSSALHDVFGNGSFFFPYIIVPNIMENSFMLEGNAVLNESWHGNGGRLYSGRFKVETLLQAKAGNITPSKVYNLNLSFPYSEIHYIIGGFYNLYMAQKYGLKEINSYFKHHSGDFIWPQYTNASMKSATKVDFESSLSEFAKEYTNIADDVVMAEGKRLASSQFFYPLSNDDSEIFFLTNESGVREPELLVFNKSDMSLNKTRDSYISGKVIKADNKYYSQGSTHTSPYKIEQRLFDFDAHLKEGSASKVVHGYLKNGEYVYFNVSNSFSQPQLYVGDEFYAQVNSSVKIDGYDNLYYFVQNDKERTLYKNKTPLYTYKGFYGIVCDVDSKGNIYFVANSELGSTLYRYKDGAVTRVSKADNIIEARLIDDEDVFVAAISDKDYYYVKNRLVSIDEEPYETKLFFEEKEYYGKYDKSADHEHIDTSKPYNPLFEMHYSGSDIFYLGNSGSLSVNFADPLSQNSLSLFASRDDLNITMTGVGYSNSQHLLNYTLSLYSIVDNANRDDVRESGMMLSAGLPFYKEGYDLGTLSTSFYQDYETTSREPLNAILAFKTEKSYGNSKYSNFLNEFKAYATKERDDLIYGAKYSYIHDLAYEFYLSYSMKYSATNSKTDNKSAFNDKRGVKLSNLLTIEDIDPSTITMTSLESSLYIKNAGYMQFGLSKVLNFSSYYFTFPLSLQRESVYTKYRRYELEDFASYTTGVNEVKIGVAFESVFLNSIPIPLNLEYIYNDAAFVKDENQIIFSLGISF